MAQANKDGTASIKRKARRGALLGASVAGDKAVNGVANAYHEGVKRVGKHKAAKAEVSALRNKVSRQWRGTIDNLRDRAIRERANIGKAMSAQKQALTNVSSKANAYNASRKAVTAAKNAIPAARQASVSQVGGMGKIRSVQDALSNAPGFKRPTTRAITNAQAPMKQAVANVKTTVAASRHAGAAADDAARGYVTAVKNVARAKKDFSEANRALKVAGQVRDSKFRQGASEIMEKAGPKATGFQKGVIKAREALDSARSKLRGAKDVPGRVAQKAGLGSRQAVSTAAKQALGNGRTAKIVGGAAKYTGKALGWSAKTAGKIAGAPVKGISAGLRGIESLGKIVTAGNTGRMANAIRGATSAAGLAGGFAAGAWIDAGLNAASYYADQAALKDAGRRAMQEAILNGADAQTANRIGREIAEQNTVGAKREEKASNGSTIVRENPGWSDVIFSREYGKEVLKGLTRALTLGIAGTGDDTAIDQAFEKSPEEQRAEQELQFQRELRGQDARTGKVLRTASGAKAYTQEEIDARVEKYNNAMAARQQATDTAQRWYGYRTSNDLANDNMTKLIAEATQARDARYAQADDLSQVRKGVALMHGPDVDEAGRSKEDRYRDTVRSNADKEFDKRINYLLANTDASNKFMEKKRAETYNALYGRDYSKGGSERGEQGIADYEEFNKAWGQMSDKERLLFDVEGFAKQLAADAKSAYENYKPKEGGEG